MKRKWIIVYVLCLGIFLVGCGLGAGQDSEVDAENSAIDSARILEEKTKEKQIRKETEETENEIEENTEAEFALEEAEAEGEELSEIVSKEKMTDGVYLIRGDLFERIESDVSHAWDDANVWLEYEAVEWKCLHPGDQLAVKGNFDPSQMIRMRCSVHDFYTFPYNIGNNIDSMTIFDGQTELNVDTITVNGQSTPVSMYMEDVWYLQDLDWKLVQTNKGNFLDGNFEKGFQVSMGGFSGTDYNEIDMAATCHVIEMPYDTYSDEPYRREANFETTKDGYFIVTIPSDFPSGYCSIATDYSMSHDDFCLYVRIE